MKGIIHTGESVRAYLAGHKSQTRRVLKTQPPEDIGRIVVGEFHPTKIDRYGEEYPGKPVYGAVCEDGSWAIKLPYKVGDVFYVKEAWQGQWKEKICLPGLCDYRIRYKAGGTRITKTTFLNEYENYPDRWRSPMFMPQWAARIFREITGLRVERVQDITELDVEAEGCTLATDEDMSGVIEWYEDRWNSINTPFKPAKKNPYTGEKEICKVSYPWDGEEMTKLIKGIAYYTVPNPRVLIIESKEAKQ